MWAPQDGYQGPHGNQVSENPLHSLVQVKANPAPVFIGLANRMPQWVSLGESVSALGANISQLQSRVEEADGFGEVGRYVEKSVPSPLWLPPLCQADN